MLRTDAQPPAAPRRPVRHELHGVEWEDPWAWLRRRDDPEVRRHLEAENAYAEAVFADTEELRETLFREMVARIEEDEVEAPIRFRGHWYYERKEAEKQYAIHCRRPAGDDGGWDESAAEEILLDLNSIAEERGLSYLKLGVLRPGPEPRLLAYSLDVAGAERYELRVLDLESGEHWPETISDTALGSAWGNDGETLYYVTRDDAQRPYRVWRHRLGDDPGDDELLWEEEDERFFVGLGKSRSRRYVFLRLGSHVTSEVRILDADDPAGRFRPLTGRRPGVEFEVDHHEPSRRFFLLTNLDALEFRLLEAPEGDPSPEQWRDLVPHDPDVHLSAVLALSDHLVLERRVGGLPSIRVVPLGGGGDVEADEPWDLHFDEDAYDLTLGAHLESETTDLRVEYQSPVTPRRVFDVDLDSGKRTIRKRDRVHGYDPSLYETERIFATARDGVGIPVDVVRRRDRAPGGPLLLYGYGAYGYALEARFHRNLINLLDRGWAFALAHVRGGSEMGEAWHEAGKLEHKENTFRDFVAVAEELVRGGHTTPRGLAIRGGSAGGLLVGAVLNLRPDLCHAAVADVPFVDVLNTMLDPSIPLTVIEYDEWGDPADAEVFGRLRGYAPYENVRRSAYPHLLVTAGLNDPRVQYWEPAKWVQRLRSRTSGGTVILRTDLDAGHSGASGRYDTLRQEALRQAFLLAAMETERES